MKIKSLTDVITNSSTQVYTLNLGEDKEAIDFIKARGHWPGDFKEFNSLDDVKEWLKENDWDWPCKWNQGRDPECFPKYNPYDDYGFDPWIDKDELKKYVDEELVEEFFKDIQLPEYETGEYLSKTGKTKEDFWELIKPLFKDMVGNAVLEYSSEYGFCEDDFPELLDLDEWIGMERERIKRQWIDNHGLEAGDKVRLVYTLDFDEDLIIRVTITYDGDYKWNDYVQSNQDFEVDEERLRGMADIVFENLAFDHNIIEYEIEKHK